MAFANRLKKLTYKEQLFCEKYVLNGFNAAKAARDAGYSEKTSNVIGSNNLTKVDILERIEEVKKELWLSAKTTPEMIMAEYAKLAFANPKDFVNGGNNVLELKTLERDKTAAVKGIKTKTIITKRMTNEGESETITMTTELDFHDKKGALDSLAKIGNLFKEDNKSEVTVYQPMPSINIE